MAGSTYNSPNSVFSSDTSTAGVGTGGLVPGGGGDVFPAGNPGNTNEGTPLLPAEYGTQDPNDVNPNGNNVPDNTIGITPGIVTPKANTTSTTGGSGAPAPTPTENAYTVAANDTLAGIAKAKGTNIQALMAANPSITNPNIIKSGQKINLPGAPTGTSASGSANTYQNSVLKAVSSVPDVSDSGDVRAAAAGVTYPGSQDTSLPPTTSDMINALIADFFEKTQEQQNAGYPDFVSNYTKNANALDIPPLQTSLMNLDNIINGTPDDIRAEITKAGGFATESQVEGMADARNKDIINKANLIQAQLTYAQNTLSTMTGLQEDQYNAAEKQYNDSTGAISTLIGYYQTAQSTATSNYARLYASNGPGFLASQATGNPYLQGVMESSLGLAPGTLTAGSPQNKEANDTWAKGITLAQGTAKIIELNQQGGYYGARTTQALTSAASSVVSSYIASPEYEAVANGAVYLNRIAGAMANPGSVSDNDLLDAITKLDTGGQAITDAQVSTITGGRSTLDSIQVLAQKVANGGVLSANQRATIQKLASLVFDNYQSTLAPLYSQTLNNLSGEGLTPEQAGLLDFNGIVSTGAANQDISVGGQNYKIGQEVDIEGAPKGVTFTVQQDGTLLGSDGNTYNIPSQ